MKRTLSAAVMFALLMMPFSTLSAGAGTLGVITGTMRGPAGPVAGVRVNVLDKTGAIVGSTVTGGNGAYSVDGLPAGIFMLQAVSPSGTVMTTSTATVSGGMKATTNLTASAAAAPAAQAAAVQNSGLSTKAVWWIVGAGAATTGIIAAVALNDDSSPSN
jgi:hypothetical protein